MLVFVVDWLIEVFAILHSRHHPVEGNHESEKKKWVEQTFSFIAESYIWRQRLRPVSSSCKRLVANEDIARSVGVDAPDIRSTGDEAMLGINESETHLPTKINRRLHPPRMDYPLSKQTFVRWNFLRRKNRIFIELFEREKNFYWKINSIRCR